MTDTTLQATTNMPIPVVDLGPFVAPKDLPAVADTERIAAAKALVSALHRFGYANVVGHGLSEAEISEALDWTKRLFDLPYEDKMKAPHPPGPIPHRGYSGIGTEKVYSQADVKKQGGAKDAGEKIRKIADFKESYEIGSEHDPVQSNIWLPEDVLPGFRGYMSSLYSRLADVSTFVLEAIASGLELEGEQLAALRKMISKDHCQLRVMHYPPISKEKLSNDLLSRLPAHHDYSTFTFLFQDSRGGLELQDPKTKDFIHAAPLPGAFVLTIGDMLQRFTNDYFVSVLHRVSVPSPDEVTSSGIAARYSIPFFCVSDFSHVIETQPHFLKDGIPAKYQPVRFDEYGAMMTKFQYKNGN